MGRQAGARWLGICGLLVLAGALGGACSDLDGLAEAEPDGGVDAFVTPPDAGEDAPPDAACPLGSRDCDGDPTNGCETNVFESPSHCGFCGNVCPTRANGFGVCVEGKCQVACNGDWGNCNANDADGCETRVDGDPLNCGACSRDCKGPCTNGVCTPEAVATDVPGSIQALGVTATVVAFYATDAASSTGYRVFRVPVGGGVVTPIAEVTPLVLGMRRFLVDGNWVAWFDEYTGVTFRSLTGSASVSRPATDFSFDDAGRVWTISNDATNAVITAFDRAQLYADGGAPPVASVGYSSYAEAAVAASAGRVFFGSYPAGSILSLPEGATAGTPATVVATDAGVPRGLSAASDRLFWVAGSLFGCARDACVPKVFGKPKASTSVAVDGSFVYWTEWDNSQPLAGQVLRCPLSGCVGAPTAVAKAQNRPRGVALYGAHVYWSVSDTSGTKSDVYRVIR